MGRTAAVVLVVLISLTISDSAARANVLATPTLVVEGQLEPSAVGHPAIVGVLLEGGQELGGTITFEVFATTDNGCHGAPLGAETVLVNGDGYYFTDTGVVGGQSIVLDARGLYPARVRYSGDANNVPVSTACGEPAVTVIAAPTITLATQEPPVVGRPVQPTANLVDAVEPTGTVLFLVFSPTDQGCQEEPLLTTVGEVVGGHTVAPQAFLPSRAGDYPLEISYEGDQMNAPDYIECGGAGAVIHVARAQPTLALTPSPPTIVGEPVAAIAALAGGYHPTGSITFNLYSPVDTTCSGVPAVTVSQSLVDARASSGAFATNAVGQYRFTAHYSGDTNNLPAESPCGTGNVTTGRARPTLTATAHPEGEGGLDISATASLAGGFEPSGVVTFTLFGPNAASCTGPAVFRVIAPVIEDTASSGAFSTGESGEFALLVTYSGDAQNEAAIGTCQRLGVSDSTAARDVIRLRLSAHASHLRLHIVCPPQADGQCSGVIQLVAIERLRGDRVVGLAARPPHARRVVVGQARYEVPAGRTQSLSIAISSGGRALARRFAGLPLQAVLQGSPSGAATARLQH